MEWGWTKQSLWVDTDASCLLCGSETEAVMTAAVVGTELQLTYGPGWEDYIFSKDHHDNIYWKECVGTLQEKLHKNIAPSKGVGKGKNKGKF